MEKCFHKLSEKVHLSPKRGLIAKLPLISCRNVQSAFIGSIVQLASVNHPFEYCVCMFQLLYYCLKKKKEELGRVCWT